MTKKYDVVVLGATGFTGKWVARYLAERYSQGQIKWAIAGRQQKKLDQTLEFLALDEAHKPDQIVADVHDENSLRALIEQIRVVISTVGPYALHGSLLVKLCAQSGVDYVDLTGEVPWMREMIDTHQSEAQASGARIVHSCGFDSIPSDMGCYFLQSQAQQRFSSPARSVKYYLLKTKGGASGGTIASMMNIIKQAVQNKTIRRLLANPYSLNPEQNYRGADRRDQSRVEYSKDLNKWTAPFVMASINTRIVRRSNALMDFKYGADFSYTETMVTGAGGAGYARAKVVSAAIKTMMLTATTQPGRKLLGLFLPDQGQGPKVDPENPGFYNIVFVGQLATGEQIRTHVHGDADPGYGSTSKMLAESAVCLALDKLDTKGGFWTPASAMGDALLTRLQSSAGLSFTVLED